jgi:hypothetical protein
MTTPENLFDVLKMREHMMDYLRDEKLLLIENNELDKLNLSRFKNSQNDFEFGTLVNILNAVKRSKYHFFQYCIDNEI